MFTLVSIIKCCRLSFVLTANKSERFDLATDKLSRQSSRAGRQKTKKNIQKRKIFYVQTVDFSQSAIKKKKKKNQINVFVEKEENAFVTKKKKST